MKRAVVTGATGFIGTHLVKELIANDISVTALCRCGSPNLNRLPPDVRVVYSFEELPAADVFYHLAWEYASGSGRGDASLQSRNITLALDALSCAARIGCKKAVILGTVYERFAEKVRKRGSFGSADFYILAKDAAHTLTNQLGYKTGIDYTYVQICHPFGMFVKLDQMLASVVKSLLDGRSVAFGDGLTYYDIISVEDLAYGLRLVGDCDNGVRQYYIGSGNPRLLRDYVLDTKRILNVETAINFGAKPSDGLHFEQNWFDISAAVQDLGFVASVKFEDMVKGAITCQKFFI